MSSPSTPQENLSKNYYRIKEVSEILGIPASTLRFWESKFTIINPRRNAAGTRFYTPEHIEKIRMIHFLVKEKGLKIEAAQMQLRNNASGVSKHAQAVNRLQGVRDKLKDLLDTLNKMK